MMTNDQLTKTPVSARLAVRADAAAPRTLHRTGLVGLTAAAALVLTACGGSNGDQDQTQAPAPTTQAATTHSSTPAATSDATDSAPTAAADRTTQVLDAVQQRYPGSVVLSLDHDRSDDHYDIDLVHDQLSIEVDERGGQLIEEDRENDADDVARASRVQVSAQDALSRASEGRQGQILDDMEVEDRNGRYVWKLDFEDASGRASGSVLLDASTGEILTP